MPKAVLTGMSKEELEKWIVSKDEYIERLELDHARQLQAASARIAKLEELLSDGRKMAWRGYATAGCRAGNNAYMSASTADLLLEAEEARFSKKEEA